MPGVPSRVRFLALTTTEPLLFLLSFVLLQNPPPVSLRIHLLHFDVSLPSIVFSLACGVVGFRGGGGGGAEAEMRAQAWQSGRLFLQV